MASHDGGKAPKVPFVTLEEHWWSPASLESLSKDDLDNQGFPESKIAELKDVSLDGPRLANMNANRVALQVVSHAPLAHINVAPDTESMPVEECRLSNDQLAERISGGEMAKRFRGFARLPMHDPVASAMELRRCVKELGFVGALVDNTLLTPSKTTESVFYDHADYDVLWKEVSDLDVPFYLHPTYPPQGPTTPQYRFEPAKKGGFSEFSSVALGAFSFGWHIDTGLHFLRLVSAGVFERFPKLKFVLGHFGESLPFFLERSARGISIGQPELKRGLIQVWRENVWIASSGFWGEAPIAASLRVTPIDRILFSVDWPFSSNEMGVEYMEWLWNSGLVTAEQWKDIAYRNSLKLFGWEESVLVEV